MITSIKKKEYIIQCKVNDSWWNTGDFETKALAIDTMKYKKSQQKSVKWRTLERITIIKETKVA